MAFTATEGMTNSVFETLVVKRCGTCGVLFAVPQSLEEELLALREVMSKMNRPKPVYQYMMMPRKRPRGDLVISRQHNHQFAMILTTTISVRHLLLRHRPMGLPWMMTIFNY